MCGIAGIFEFSAAPVVRARLRSMMSRIAHRGPDGAGWLEDDGHRISEGGAESDEPARSMDVPSGPFPGGPRVGLGHLRLAITDLSDAGRQPMSRENGRWWIVFNGAIYNAPELRRELEAMGEPFSTSTDTEVLLAAYVRWGEEALHRFNGMWAFAIWDARNRELFCARDRFGIKPFFYTSAGGVLGFASEPKALRPLRPAEPDMALIRSYLSVGATAGGGSATSYAHYRALPDGCLLRADSRGTRVERWYDLDSRVAGLEPPGTLPEAADRVRGLLESSVRLRLRSDVPVGLLLSGGVDSSGIGGIIAASDPVSKGNFSGRTISNRYPHRPEIDESVYIHAALASTGFEGDFIEPTVDGFERELDDFAYSVDALTLASVHYAQWRLFRRARELRLPVMLVGQGSDELFAGYEPWELRAKQLYRAGRRGQALREAFLSSRRRWNLGRGLRHTLGIWRSRNSLETCGCGPAGTLQAHQRHLLLVNYLPTLLDFEDRNSMAWGIEARTPFLDYRLVELARTLPDGFLLRDGWTKVVLREALRGLVPERILRRPRKLGLPGPVEDSRGVGSEGLRRAWSNLEEAGWLDGLKLDPPRDFSERLSYRVRFLDAWRRKCLDG